MKNIFISVLFLSLFCFAAIDTFAQCDCGSRAGITAQEEFRLANAVFVGKVIELNKTLPDKKTGNYTETAKFELIRVWKQDLEKFTIITNEIQGCLNGFEENKEWLVYVYKRKNGKLGTYCCCSRTKSLPKANEDIKAFESEGEKETKVVDNSKPKD